jgi:hypothetical protein
MSVDVIEYRNGNERENSVCKLTGLNRATDVTLKRGIIGSTSTSGSTTSATETRTPCGQ